MQNTTPFLVQYSDKSIAVFGNTFPIKDQLKALKGKYNKHLTYDNTKVSGWIFGSKIKDVLEELKLTMILSLLKLLKMFV